MYKKRLNLICGAIFAFLLIAAVLIRIGTPRYKVEDFTGRPYQDVAEWISRNSVNPDKVIISFKYSETVPENTVIHQNLRENAVLSGDNSLVVTVSKGSDPNLKIEMPDFSGMNQDEIQSWLDNEGLTDYRFISQINEDAEEGLFLASDPEVGYRVTRNQPVTITICEHDHSTTAALPDFKGKTADDIQAWADKNNITVNFIYYYDTAASGTFLFSDYEPGTQIDKGSSISVAVSAGPSQQ